MKRSFALAVAFVVGFIAINHHLFAQSEIAKFSGNGARSTQPFAVPNGWEVQWNSQGDIFQVYLYTSQGELVNVVANQDKAGQGSSYIAKGGNYYLQVNALGSWTITVVKSSGGQSTSGTVDFSGTGARTTRPFTMRGPWTVYWNAKGDIFQIYLYSGNGDLVDVSANQMQAGEGSSYVARGGTFYLEVNALGIWVIRVALNK